MLAKSCRTECWGRGGEAELWVHSGTVKRRHLKMAAIGNVSNEGISVLTQLNTKQLLHQKEGIWSSKSFTQDNAEKVCYKSSRCLASVTISSWFWRFGIDTSKVADFQQRDVELTSKKLSKLCLWAEESHIMIWITRAHRENNENSDHSAFNIVHPCTSNCSRRGQSWMS